MTRRSKVALGDLFPELGLLEEYDSYRSLEIHRLAEVGKSEEGDLVFVAQETFLPFLNEARATAVVIQDSLWTKAQSQARSGGPAFLRSQDAMLAFAKASAHFTSEDVPTLGEVHPTAEVHATARLGTNVSVGAHAVIEEGAEIEENVVIHARAHVGPRCHIAEGSVLFPGVVLYQDSQIGARVRIHANSVIGSDGFGYVQEKTPEGVKHVKIHHLGRVVIGADTEIGACVSIDRGTLGDTSIGKGVIIDNQVQIGHNCQIGDGAIICGCAGLAGSVKVEKYAVVAGLVGVNNKVTIGAGAQVGGHSAVYGNIPPGQKWAGNPARPQREHLRIQAFLNRMPEIVGKKKNQTEKEHRE